MSVRRNIEMLRLWFRLCSMSNYRVTKRIFLWDYNLSLAGKKNWSSNVKTVLDDCNMDYFYHTPELGNMKMSGVKTVLFDAKKTLYRKHAMAWSTKVASLPKLRTYKLIKQKFGTEEYVRFNMCRTNRSVIARLRNGTYPLNIELGRYRNIPLESRICPSCDTNDVESEIHFLCDCTAYDQQRLNLFEMIENILNADVKLLSNVEKIKIMLSNKLVLKHVCIYINAASMIRNAP